MPYGSLRQLLAILFVFGHHPTFHGILHPGLSKRLNDIQSFGRGCQLVSGLVDFGASLSGVAAIAVQRLGEHMYKIIPAGGIGITVDFQ